MRAGGNQAQTIAKCLSGFSAPAPIQVIGIGLSVILGMSWNASVWKIAGIPNPKDAVAFREVNLLDMSFCICKTSNGFLKH